MFSVCCCSTNCGGDASDQARDTKSKKHRKSAILANETLELPAGPRKNQNTYELLETKINNTSYQPARRSINGVAVALLKT